MHMGLQAHSAALSECLVTAISIHNGSISNGAHRQSLAEAERNYKRGLRLKCNSTFKIFALTNVTSQVTTKVHLSNFYIYGEI